MQRPKQLTRPTLFFALTAIALALICWVYVRQGLSDADADTADLIVNELRIPRMICAMGVGALLSIAGAIMQGLFRNPLVEPYTMGISGGAVVGVAVVFTCGAVATFGGMTVTLGAAIGGLLSMVIVLLVRRAVGYDTSVMLICGIMVSFIASAATTLMLSLATHEDMSQILSWTIGSFSSADPQMAWLAMLSGAIATIASPLAGNLLNVMSLGDSEARSLGVDTRRASGWLFSIATILSAIAVATAGIVAFVGMAVPHLVRTLIGQDNRLVLPASGLMGALLLLACDFVAKVVIYPRELPAGAICAILGGLMFVYMALKSGQKGSIQF